MKIPMDCHKKIDLLLEDIYGQSKETGEKLAAVGLGKTQIRGLESIVSSATRFSEILNFIKNQAGKEKKNQWMSVARDMIGQLERLEEEAATMGGGDSGLVLAIKMKLARGWGRQVIAHYLYAAKLKETKEAA